MERLGFKSSFLFFSFFLFFFLFFFFFFLFFLFVSFFSVFFFFLLLTPFCRKKENPKEKLFYRILIMVLVLVSVIPALFLSFCFYYKLHPVKTIQVSFFFLSSSLFFFSFFDSHFKRNTKNSSCTLSHGLPQLAGQAWPSTKPLSVFSPTFMFFYQRLWVECQKKTGPSFGWFLCLCV